MWKLNFFVQKLYLYFILGYRRLFYDNYSTCTCKLINNLYSNLWTFYMEIEFSANSLLRWSFNVSEAQMLTLRLVMNIETCFSRVNAEESYIIRALVHLVCWVFLHSFLSFGLSNLQEILIPQVCLFNPCVLLNPTFSFEQLCSSK